MTRKRRSATASTSGPSEEPRRRRAWTAAGLITLGAAIVTAVIWYRSADPVQRPAGPTPAGAAYVGGQTCSECHQSEYAAWRRSHHALAMQEASARTVLGDFGGASLRYAGVTSRFFERDGRFFVTTDGPDGTLQDYPVKYTFGITPLQQYLIEFPGGRLQALSIAWDSRPKDEGGGRWFHLYPNDTIDHRDPLHWTRLDQNWNWMCAECHSTGLKRNYDLAGNLYRTQWSDLNVSCEACHGPGSVHVAWAKNPSGQPSADMGLTVRLNERRGVSWRLDPGGGAPGRSQPRTSQREIETCALCHARRAPVSDGLAHAGRLMDSHDPALLTEGLYFADGQQQDEVYNYASFLQSRMHAAGVTCSDCHDPHSGKTRMPGNAVCLQCHASTTYAVPAHTLHASGSRGDSCAACHMPTRTYMVVDARHDHSFRIPRPDLSERYGLPNACQGCHGDKTNQWAANVIERRYGPERKGFQRFVDALHAARTAAPGAEDELVGLAADAGAPAIARATALAELRAFPGARALAVIESGVRDADPLLRSAAADALQAFPVAERLRLAEPLLADQVKVVRLKAARTLAVTSLAGLTEDRQSRLRAAFAEYVASQAALAERPEAHMNLGLFYSERAEHQTAEQAYRTAIRLQPSFAPAYVNLADLYRALGRDGEAEVTVLEGLKQAPGDGDLSHALALVRIRQGGRGEEAIQLLQHAAERRPDNPRYAYVYAVALHDAGRLPDSIDALESALTRFPNDREMLFAAAAYAHEAGRADRASAHARRFAAVAADDPRAAALLKELGVK